MERAKIFQPFDALAGFREAIAAKERITVDRIELSEDELYELDWKIHSLMPGDMISVVYYDKDTYLRKTGIVTAVNCAGRELTVIKQVIPLDDIAQIDLLQRNPANSFFA